jgi:hypothetical protein
MSKVRKIIDPLIIGACLISGGIAGCSSSAPKASSEETGKLQEAKVAAESAERKLSELRQERVQLEQQLQAKQSEVDNTAQ